MNINYISLIESIFNMYHKAMQTAAGNMPPCMILNTKNGNCLPL